MVACNKGETYRKSGSLCQDSKPASYFLCDLKKWGKKATVGIQTPDSKMFIQMGGLILHRFSDDSGLLTPLKFETVGGKRWHRWNVMPSSQVSLMIPFWNELWKRVSKPVAYENFSNAPCYQYVTWHKSTNQIIWIQPLRGKASKIFPFLNSAILAT